MKNHNNKVTAVLFVVALALAPMIQAAQGLEGGPTVLRAAPTARPRPAAVARPNRTPVNLAANDGAGANSDANGSGIADANLPVVSVFNTDNVIRGKTGTFVLRMKPTRLLGGTYVNFSLSGTAVQGADYKIPVSPAYISQSGYGVIQIETLPDLRGSAYQQACSVIVTLQAGAGYALGKSNSAIMYIK